MKMGKIYRFALVLALITSAISCSKSDQSTSGGSDARDNIVGNWTCDENSKISGNASYTVNISKNVASTDGIIMKNFYQLGNNTNTLATQDGNNITIPTQSVSGYSINGFGTVSGTSSIYFNFTTNDGQKTDSVKATFHH